MFSKKQNIIVDNYKIIKVIKYKSLNYLVVLWLAISILAINKVTTLFCNRRRYFELHIGKEIVRLILVRKTRG